MTYASVMVHVEPHSGAEPRLKFAVQAAAMFEARLIGVGAEAVYPMALGAFSDPAFMADVDEVRLSLKSAETAFKEVTAAYSGEVEWRSDVNFPNDVMARQSRAADLVIANTRPLLGAGEYSAADPGELIMRCGRPILMAPYGVSAFDPSSIVIGYKDTRETRRAISDALPFLARAAQVLIVEILDDDKAEPAAAARLADVAAFLARHGVKAATAVRPKPVRSAAADLEEVISLQEAGLLVIGGYGHSRLHEWMFGGVTLKMLENATVPVLISH
jgi:nucleotide-binding universal stress UspA family protein